MTDSLAGWVRREEPLPPAAVLGLGDVAPPLAAATALMRRRDHEVRVAAGPTHVLVLGREEDLPWADGAIFLGWECGVLLSTTYRPSVHPDLLAQALRQRLGSGNLAVTPTQVVQYTASDGPADAGWLDAYAAESSG